MVKYNDAIVMSSEYAALIPCYNVGDSCIPVIHDSAAHVAMCMAIDDGSTDDTFASMSKAKTASVEILRHETNLGKGAAILTGFRWILEKHPDVAAIITLDGDGQHDPSLLPAFMEMHREKGVDLIYGNRMLNVQTMPWHRRKLNALSNLVISRICRQPIVDSQCGYRLYSRALIETLAGELKTGRYELETEILIRAARRGMKIETIPVSTIYTRQIMKLSHHSFYDVLRITRLVTKYFFQKD